MKKKTNLKLINISVAVKRDYLLVLLIQLVFFLSRFINYRYPRYNYDHGVHLLILKYIALGKVPYQEFSLVHMPGLYLLLAPFVKQAESLFSVMSFYYLIVSFNVLLYYFLLKKIFKEKWISFAGVILLVIDPLFNRLTSVVGIDPVLSVILMITLLFLEKKKFKRFDSLVFLFLYILGFIFKLSTIYYIFFWFLAFFLTNLTIKEKRNKTYDKLFFLFLAFFIVSYFGLLILFPEMSWDIFTSHLLRPSLSIRQRLENLFRGFEMSVANLLPAVIISSYGMLQVGSKKMRHYSLFFLIYILFSIFLPKNFWYHHLLIILPVSNILVLMGLNDLLVFIKDRSVRWLWTVSVVISIVLAYNLFSLYKVARFNLSSSRQIVDKLSAIDGTLYTSNNYFYFLSGKYPPFWYYATIPDAPCRWGKCCEIHQKLLQESDYALLDESTKGHVTDSGFYDYLHENFYLDYYDPGLNLMFYSRR